VSKASVVVKPTTFERAEERRHHKPFCRAGRRCVTCRAFKTRRLVFVIRPDRFHPELPFKAWEPFLGVAVAPWQVFGAAGGGLCLGTPTEARVREWIDSAIRIAGGRGFKVEVRRSPRLRVRSV
jgi:hypothetical protein